jgi:hypothetical protein
LDEKEKIERRMKVGLIAFPSPLEGVREGVKPNTL